VLKALDRTGDEDGQATEGATSRVLDIERFLKRCMGNRELAGRLLSKFEQQTEVDLEAIRTGMRSGDISSLRAAAHRLKGAAANLSAEPVRACAAALYSTSAGVPAAEMEARIVTLEEAIIRLHSSIGELKTKLTTVG
jgi:HPt (histidine-containing phosphotransfer) domain-containing protein